MADHKQQLTSAGVNVQNNTAPRNSEVTSTQRSKFLVTIHTRNI
jgi:hypothetical protein